jgi:hypothetical protein
MFLQLRFRVERAAGVVEVDLAEFVQAAVLRRAQIVQQGRFFIARETRDEIGARFFDLKFFLSADFRHMGHNIPSTPGLRTKAINSFRFLKVVLPRQSRCSLSGAGKSVKLRQ